MKPIIEKYSWRGVNFFEGASSEEHYKQKSVCFGSKIKNLERFGFYDFFLPLDCDEFIALRHDKTGVIDTRKESIHEAFENLDKENGLFSVNFNYPNSLAAPREFFGWEFRKQFVRKDVFQRMDHGGHSITPRNSEPAVDTRFAYIHFCYRPFRSMVQSAREKVKIEPNIMTLPDSELRKHRLAKYFFMSEDEYYSSFSELEGLPRFSAPHLVEFFRQYVRRLPFENEVQ